MGNNQTSRAAATHMTLDDFLNELTIQWPDAELELEEAYKCLSGNNDPNCLNEGYDYREVEPVIRHFLYTMGLAEYIDKFTDNEGRLNLKEIRPLMQAVGIKLDVRQKLNMDDWKILLVAWVRRIQEAQQLELMTWQTTLERMQAEQNRRYQTSLEAFKQAYIDEIAEYHKSVEAHHRQEENYRREWEGDIAVQQAYKASQLTYLDKMNAEARKNYKQRLVAAQQKDAIQVLDKETRRLSRDTMAGADRVAAFVYPVQLNSVSGAPISGGANIPAHRPKLSI